MPLRRLNRGLGVPEDPDRQPRRDRRADHPHRPADGHQDGPGAFRRRRRLPGGGDGRRGGQRRPAARGPVLPRDGQDHRGGPADRRPGDPSGLWLSFRTGGVRQGPGRGGDRLHRAQPRGHRRHGRQDRLQAPGRRGGGLHRAGASGRDPGRRPRHPHRRGHRLSGHAEGLRRRRRPSA